VECARHGKRYATFVCQHLLGGAHKGWVELENGDEERPDVWCSDCDLAWLAGGEVWSDEFAERARIRMVCSGCYDELRERHRLR
jgi:hypothetical protein